jgi:two-component sensor histidine kinase
MLIAMISLERRQTRDTSAADALDSIANRIRVLSRFQDRLVRVKSGPVVNSRLFIADLCEDLMKAFSELRPIRLEMTIEDHALPQETRRGVG